MKKLPFAAFVLVLFVFVFALAGCASASGEEGSGTSVYSESPSNAVVQPTEVKDYVADLKLAMNSDTVKQEVTVKTFVDGDTTHFYVPESVMEGGVLKARYLAINTPESTGRVEEYGKKASNFTRERLSKATSIIIESDDDKWNRDSTGSRYLVWVWYRTSDSEEYRNLNVEILQNGLAIASSTANNRYGSIAMAALMQAKALKLNVFSGEKDPDFYYGDAVELTMSELRLNIERYNGIKVAFEGVVAKDDGGSVYIEEYNPQTDMYNGVSVYYGFNLPGPALKALSVGNRVRIVGTVQYYEAGGLYQVSGLSYKLMDPDNPNNVKMISSGHSAAFVKTLPSTFVDGKVSVVSMDDDGVEVVREYDYAYLALNTTLELDNLFVEDVRTTSDPSSSSYGAMTLVCSCDGGEVHVRTTVFTDGKGNLITADAYRGRTIDVKGLVDLFDGSYQIKVISPKDIVIKD